MIVRRCVKCMENIEGVSGSVCPHCGFDNSGTNISQPPYAMCWNTILHGRYLIGNVLGQGGFGITYIGFDLVLNIKVAIKEYFPMGVVTRDQNKSNRLLWNSVQMTEKQRQKGYEDFLKEARKLAKIDSIPSIVRVRDTFFDNETAYIVMDYVDGVTLKAKLLKEGTMSFSECIRLLTPMLEGLEEIHRLGMIHRDISPDNIMVQPDGSVKLLDLGAAKDMSAGGQQSQLVTKNGFSPLEQYTESGKIGPWTDVYAVCATIYYCIIGKVIPSALDRMSQPELPFLPEPREALPEFVTAALKAGLAVETEARIQSIGELLQSLKEGPKKKHAFKWKWAFAVIGGIAAVTAVALLAGRGGETEKGSSVSADAKVENMLVVEQFGTSNANLLNYGGWAQIPKEYEYFIAGDNALYICSYNQEDQTFYLDQSEKISDFGAYITLGEEYVYFLYTDNKTNAVCRMKKDGSDIRQLYSVADGRAFKDLQYVRFSDKSEYLYFALENEQAGNWSSIYRYNLKTDKVETVIEGDIFWWNLYENTLYYTEVVNADGVLDQLMKAEPDGNNPEILNTDKDFTSGFAVEDKLYLWSYKDEAFLVCDLDGTPNSEYKDFYNLKIDPNCSVGYGDGWIYYTDISDQCIHRVRTNGTGDAVFLEGHSAYIMCCNESWMWFAENTPTEKRKQNLTQAYIAFMKDGTNLIELMEPECSWELHTAWIPDFQYTENESGDGVVITGYTGKETSFAIPEKIDDKPVTGIAEEAFKGSGIMELGIPEGIRYIGDYAFYECEDLTFIGLPEGMTKIGAAAFGSCIELEDVDFPNSLIEIGEMAFAETWLSDVLIPASVTDIGAAAFAVNSEAGFTEFEVSEENLSFFEEDGILYGYVSGQKVLIACPSGREGTCQVSEDALGIYPYAFSHCKNTVNISKSVRIIGENAFWDTNTASITVHRDCKMPENLGKEITVNFYEN